MTTPYHPKPWKCDVDGYTFDANDVLIKDPYLAHLRVKEGPHFALGVSSPILDLEPKDKRSPFSDWCEQQAEWNE